MALFQARPLFNSPSCIPKTYFLGHHQSGITQIKNVLPSVSLILECRDFRLPLSTRNPKLEQITAGCQRLIIYTKADLGSDSLGVKETLLKLHLNNVVFWSKNNFESTRTLLRRLNMKAREIDSLTGLRVLIVGMPNVGKSSLLNALRSASLPGKAKAAKTGDQAGVTRKLSTSVRIVESEEKGGFGAGIFALDSPGIFQPYVEDRETMIKVALVQGIKKGLVSDEILADYLLYRMNYWNPYLYERYCKPTNDIREFLAAVSRRDGLLKAGGLPNFEESAARFLSQWRDGKLGKYILDDISKEAMHTSELSLAKPLLSLSQAKKVQKLSKKEKSVT